LKQDQLNYFKLSGFAQGTSYHITYGSKDSVNLQPEIDSLLRNFDLSLSSYDSSSVISKINRNEDLTVDDKFREVYEAAVEVNIKSGGAFDLTVMPLVNAWGFGPGRKTHIDQEVIDSLLKYVGMDKIAIEGDQLVKESPGVSVDVNAIAQGYSVDIVAEYLVAKGIENYMVEIGGEVKTRGRNPKAEVWKIGLDRPEYGNVMPGMQMQAILKLNEKSLATSGNYRKFYEEDGIKYSHSIDPVTGYPVRHEILSATIIAESCMMADAYATACMVMGLEEAKEMLVREELDGYLIYGDLEGQYQVWMTDGFEKYIYKEIDSE
jgi:thiamine biosynthesis lipoprotein